MVNSDQSEGVHKEESTSKLTNVILPSSVSQSKPLLLASALCSDGRQLPLIIVDYFFWTY